MLSGVEAYQGYDLRCTAGCRDPYWSRGGVIGGQGAASSLVQG